MTAEDIRRTLARIAHEIVERNRASKDLVLVGIRTRGVPIAERLAVLISHTALTLRSISTVSP